MARFLTKVINICILDFTASLRNNSKHTCQNQKKIVEVIKGTIGN